MRRLHGGGGRAGAGQTNDEIDAEVAGMGGNKGEEQKGNVSWAEVFMATSRPRSAPPPVEVKCVMPGFPWYIWNTSELFVA